MTSPPGQFAIYALSSAGAETARRIAAGLEENMVYLPGDLARNDRGELSFSKLTLALRDNFTNYAGHVVVAAAGLVVRAIAPLLTDKSRDPAVVVVDQAGRFAVSLLSGHLGGANRLAEKVAAILGGQAVITTATDVAHRPSLEVIARDLGMKIENLPALAAISRAVLEARPVIVYDPGLWLGPSLADWPEAFTFPRIAPTGLLSEPLVWVGPEQLDLPTTYLILRPPALIVGLGCNRGTSQEELEDLLVDVFQQVRLSPLSIARLATIEAKQDEPGLLALAEKWNLPINFYPAADLATIQAPHPSAAVMKHMGVNNVCETAALLAARTDRLLVTKRKSLNATLAVAQTTSTSSALAPGTKPPLVPRPGRPLTGPR